MNEEQLQRMYGELLARRAPSDRSGCPPPEELLHLAERRLPEGRRLAVLDHVMACAECRPEFDLLRSVAEGGEGIRPRRVPLLALAATVALVLGAGLVWQVAERGRSPMLRGADWDVALLVPEPGATLELQPNLVWRSVPGALRYRVELLYREGGVVATWRTEDTTTSVPVSGGLRAGAEYQWWVRAELEGGAEWRSEVRRFRLR